MTDNTEPTIDEQLDEMIKRDAMALCCNKCDGGGYDYDNTKDCNNCNGTGLSEWQNEYLIKQIKALISDQVAKARLDEVERFIENEDGEITLYEWVDDPEFGTKTTTHPISLNDRLAELKSQEDK